jgi:hypothetical protein
VTATVTWHLAGANVLAFVALLSLSYVLPQALKETMNARLVTRLAGTCFLVVGALNRLNAAADAPVSWWSEAVQYAQPVFVVVFLIGLSLDTARAVRQQREALEMVYTNLGTEAGDRVAAIFRALR